MNFRHITSLLSVLKSNRALYWARPFDSRFCFMISYLLFNRNSTVMIVFFFFFCHLSEDAQTCEPPSLWHQWRKGNGA